MVFESLGTTLDRPLRRSPIQPVLLALKVEKEAGLLLPHWTKMHSFREGRLTLSTPSPTHSQELYLKSRKLIKKINEDLGRKIVEEIRFKVTPESSPA